MNKNLWICIKDGSRKFLRPMNHANCESWWFISGEVEAEKKKIWVDNGYVEGKLYNIEKEVSVTIRSYKLKS